MPTKRHTLTHFVAILGLLLWTGACRSRKPVVPTPPEKAAAPLPSPAPTVTLTAEPSSIQSGNSATLSWTSQNATDLDLGPGVGKVQSAGSTEETPVDFHIKDAYFDLDKANIRPDAEQSLTTDAGFLKEHPSIKFTIEGHCDERGSEEYNLGLGDLRATAAKNYLVNTGVSADRISTISYGKTHPVCTDETEECWQKNRRAHFHYGGVSK